MENKIMRKFFIKNKFNDKFAGGERGAALAMAIIIMAILAVIAITALAFSSTEARVAASDLQRTQTFYAASTGLEKMTNDFSNLFLRKMNPTDDDLNTIETSSPPEMQNEGFKFSQNLEIDQPRLTQMQTVQSLPANVYPRVNISEGPYAGLFANVVPYKMSSTAKMESSSVEVKLEREFNNYLVPLFQFGIYSTGDLEFHPGPLMTFNGRIHANENIYAMSSTRFLNRVTSGGEFVRDAMRDGGLNLQGGNTDVSFVVNGVNVPSSLGGGSVKKLLGLIGGPSLPGSILGQRGYYPGSPTGVVNTNWESESVKPPVLGLSDRFGGQLLTQTTGGTKINLPLELEKNSTAELIKRKLPTDSDILKSSRYHEKAQIRILLDDEDAGSGAANAAGIPDGRGVQLKDFLPSILNGGSVLKRIADDGTISGSVNQKNPNGTTTVSSKVPRKVSQKLPDEYVNGEYVPPGANIRGKILIEIVKPDGTAIDVTQTILSMGVTEGEPNGIVYLQRPLWAAYVQGSRDRLGNGFDMVNLTRNYLTAADGEIIDIVPATHLRAGRGFINLNPLTANEDTGAITREAFPVGDFNQIVPINVYNVREGWYRSTLDRNEIFDRGLTSVVELNMRNLSRWVDGIYDTNLLAGTNAVSANIAGTEGYVVYVSDRRGDNIKTEYAMDGSSFLSTNGIVDNEDIYGPNNTLDEGEDVIDFGRNPDGSNKKGSLQKDTAELPDGGTICCAPLLPTAPVTEATRLARSKTVLKGNNLINATNANPSNYFRRSVRIFDGEKLSNTAAAGKLSPTKGITVSSENMVYIWGNFNATGITGIPTNGSTINDGGYTGAQVPSSIVADAFIPLSKTWFDAFSAFYPAGGRTADENLPNVTQSTTVRAGIIAGQTISAMNGIPGRDILGNRRNGGIHNFPRFLEMWDANTPWNSAGSLIPLYRSTQAVAQHDDFNGVNYSAPRRNWSFDPTFLTPNKLPPGTPFFQYTQATGFRQSLY